MEYLITIAFIAVFAGVIIIWSKKENKILDTLIANLTEEQKENLQNNQIEDFDEKKHTWIQRGMIAEAVEKGNVRIALKVLWYNTIIQNDTLNNYQYADITMKKLDFIERGFNNGDFVKIYIDVEKGAKII